MKTREFVRLAQFLLPVFPRLVVKGPMMLMSPICYTLRGLCFEGSGFDRRSFYLWVFWIPLSVPTEHVHFSFGKRLDALSGEGWSADMPDLSAQLETAIREHAMPLLLRFEAPGGELEAAKSAAAGSRNPYAHEALAHTLARAGERPAAIESLKTLDSLLDLAVPWQREIASRANVLKEALIKGHTEVQELLDTWRDETIRKLGLEKYTCNPM